MANENVVVEVRTVLDQHARLPVGAGTIATHEDLFRAGMSSHASVNVMLALEDAFDIEFPDAMLNRNAFATIAAIQASVEQLLVQDVA